MEKTLKIKYIHSPIGRDKTQKATIKGFGFTRLNQVKDFPDTPSIRGMVKKVHHLVKIVE